MGASSSDDCPVFDGLFRFCQTYTGGSIDGARKLMSGTADIAINWAGGLHHASKGHAAGFCYVNDIVLAILEMLRYYPRVLYIDIDAHHGDGVEEAFSTSDRVMTLSLHRFQSGFFPGTGAITHKGHGRGKFYSVNVPLRSGISDAKYETIFRPVLDEIVQRFRPHAIVLQCGADSLGHDKIGGLNLSIRGHGSCVEYVKGLGVPLLVLGGGGYRVQNVARCWAYETGVLLNTELADDIPDNDYLGQFAPDYKLHLPKQRIADKNSTKYLDGVREEVFENLRELGAAPSVQLQHAPPTLFVTGSDGDHVEE